MSNLILHCGASATSLTEMESMPIPSPRGTRHAVRPFHEDIYLAREALEKEGFILQDEAYGVTEHDGMPTRFFGVIQALLPGLIDGNDDYGLMIGLRGSYDQSLSRAIAVGSRVFVCDNLAFSGEIDLRTKQTIRIGDRVPKMLKSAIGFLPEMAQHQDKRFEAYRNEQLTHEEGDHFLMELVREQALKPSQLGTALAEWDKPRHDEHAEQDFSVWRLHNAVTEAIKPSENRQHALQTTWQRTRKLTDFLDARLGIDYEHAEPEPAAA